MIMRQLATAAGCYALLLGLTLVVTRLVLVGFPDREELQGRVHQALEHRCRKSGHSPLGYGSCQRCPTPLETLPRNFLNALAAAEGTEPLADNRALRAAFILAWQGPPTKTALDVARRFPSATDSKPDLPSQIWEIFSLPARLQHVFSEEELQIMRAHLFGLRLHPCGLDTTAKALFGKTLAALSTPEAAFMAGTFRSPAHHIPHFSSAESDRDHTLDRGRQRRNRVLQKMFELGFVGSEELQTSLSAPLEFRQASPTAEFILRSDDSRILPDAGKMK